MGTSILIPNTVTIQLYKTCLRYKLSHPRYCDNKTPQNQSQVKVISSQILLQYNPTKPVIATSFLIPNTVRYNSTKPVLGTSYLILNTVTIQPYKTSLRYKLSHPSYCYNTTLQNHSQVKVISSQILLQYNCTKPVIGRSYLIPNTVRI